MNRLQERDKLVAEWRNLVFSTRNNDGDNSLRIAKIRDTVYEINEQIRQELGHVGTDG